MRIINSDISAEYQKEFLSIFVMIEFVLNSATYRFNETEEIIYDADGNPFYPRSFTFDNIQTTTGMSASSLDISIDNTDQMIGALLLGEDVRNKTANLYIGAVVKDAATPITLLNPSFEIWTDASHCTNWDLYQAGTGGTLAREASIVRYGTYSAKLTVGTNYTYIMNTLGTEYNGRYITVGAWCYSANTAANKVGMIVRDYVGGTYPHQKIVYFSNGAAWEQLITSIYVDPNSTRVEIILINYAGANAPSYWEYASARTGTLTVDSKEIVTEKFMQGFIGGWELAEDNKATITIQNEFVLWSKKTLRTQSSSCPWVFKGVECTYAGQETWCDQSIVRCASIGNSNSFGGFRYLPSITGTEIKWGGQ
jgi:hypothetical protein